MLLHVWHFMKAFGEDVQEAGDLEEERIDRLSHSVLAFDNRDATIARQTVDRTPPFTSENVTRILVRVKLWTTPGTHPSASIDSSYPPSVREPGR